MTSFRIIRKGVVESMLNLNTPHPAVGALLLSVTPRIANLRVAHDPRIVGSGGYTLSKLFALTLSRFLSFSALPLRLLAVVGMLGILASLLTGAFYMTRYWMGGVRVPGFTTLAILLVAMSGFNFFAFGIVGEYLLRILQSVYQTPQYQIREIVGQSPSSSPPVDQGEEKERASGAS